MNPFRKLFGPRPEAIAHLEGALAAKESLPFQSDGQPVTEDLPLPVDPPTERAAVLPPEDRLLPLLRGTDKQVKWAFGIRERALKLQWPTGDRALLSQISDATWWIANKSIPYTMKYKYPEPHQRADRDPQPDLDTKAKKVADVAAEIRGEQVLMDTQRRLNEAHAFAQRMSEFPDLAELAMLALMTKLYKEPAMKLPLKRRAEKLLSVWQKGTVAPEDKKYYDKVKEMLV